MYTYDVVLRSGDDSKTIQIRATSGGIACTIAMGRASELTKETGTEWRVGRCDPA